MALNGARGNLTPQRVLRVLEWRLRRSFWGGDRGWGRVVSHHIADETLPSRYLACVSRQESAKKLQGIFYDLGGLGPSVEVLVGENVRAAQEADVILLWYAIDHE